MGHLAQSEQNSDCENFLGFVVIYVGVNVLLIWKDLPKEKDNIKTTRIYGSLLNEKWLHKQRMPNELLSDVVDL